MVSRKFENLHEIPLPGRWSREITKVSLFFFRFIPFKVCRRVQKTERQGRVRCADKPTCRPGREPKSETHEEENRRPFDDPRHRHPRRSARPRGKSRRTPPRRTSWGPPPSSKIRSPARRKPSYCATNPGSGSRMHRGAQRIFTYFVVLPTTNRFPKGFEYPDSSKPNFSNSGQILMQFGNPARINHSDDVYCPF